jgi:hypothetical protein
MVAFRNVIEDNLTFKLVDWTEFLIYTLGSSSDVDMKFIASEDRRKNPLILERLSMMDKLKHVVKCEKQEKQWKIDLEMMKLDVWRGLEDFLEYENLVDDACKDNNWNKKSTKPENKIPLQVLEDFGFEGINSSTHLPFLWNEGIVNASVFIAPFYRPF